MAESPVRDSKFKNKLFKNKTVLKRGKGIIIDMYDDTHRHCLAITLNSLTLKPLRFCVSLVPLWHVALQAL